MVFFLQKTNILADFVFAQSFNWIAKVTTNNNNNPENENV